MKVATIVGARPQMIKAAPVSKKLRAAFKELLVHTGQHYDDQMSAVFFDELGIPSPDYNLGVGSGTHGEQTGRMLAQIERVLLSEQADWVLLYGDTNSTLAGALAAAKLQIPVFHVEAGMRSYNRKMPEEINRVVTDHVSAILACPSQTAALNLAGEGFENIVAGGALWDWRKDRLRGAPPGGRPLVVNTGDVMYDALLFYRRAAAERSDIMSRLALREKEYILATLHRAENTDDPGNLSGALQGLQLLEKKVILPLHPRTRKKIEQFDLLKLLSGRVRAIDPVGYLDMLVLTDRAGLVVTDSGGLQKEAFMLGTPCITLREETEWVETVQAGANTLAGLGGRLLGALREFPRVVSGTPNPYGDGKAAERIAGLLAAGLHDTASGRS